MALCFQRRRESSTIESFGCSQGRSVFQYGATCGLLLSSMESSPSRVPGPVLLSRVPPSIGLCQLSTCVAIGFHDGLRRQRRGTRHVTLPFLPSFYKGILSRLLIPSPFHHTTCACMSFSTMSRGCVGCSLHWCAQSSCWYGDRGTHQTNAGGNLTSSYQKRSRRLGSAELRDFRLCLPVCKRLPLKDFAPDSFPSLPRRM
jgi:hypothetical protein